MSISIGLFSPTVTTIAADMCKFQEFLRDGFLPSQLPLQSLPPKFAEWEALLESAKWAIANFKRKDTLGSFMRRWRAGIRKVIGIRECDHERQ